MHRDYKNRLNHKKKDFVEIVQCCSDPIIDDENVCRNCGTVVEKVMQSKSKRAYSQEEVESRKVDSPRWREFGPRTLLGKHGAKTDSKGKVIKSDNQSLFNRLGKIQNSLISSIERNFWDAKPQMKLACSKLNIPDYIKETAWRIYAASAKKKLTMGRSIAGFIGGSLYIAIRVHEFPRLLDEVVETMTIPRRPIHQAMGLIVKDVLPELKLKYKPIDPIQLVYRFGNDLEMPMKVQQIGVKILEHASHNGYNRVGKDPRGIASAALYLAGKNGNIRKTQKEVCEVSKITEVTLRTRVRDLKKKLAHS